MPTSIDLDPILGWPALALLLLALLVALGWAAWRGWRGWALRLAASVVLLAALLQPGLTIEDRRYDKDIVLMLVDRSASQEIGGRRETTDIAVSSLGQELGNFEDLELIEVAVGELPEATGRGTMLAAALNRELSNLDPERIAGAILVTDGQVHDVGIEVDIPAPVHALISGARNEFDRQLVVKKAPAFAVVGETAVLEMSMVDHGSSPTVPRPSEMKVSLNGDHSVSATMEPEQDVFISVEIGSPGPNLVHVEISAVEDELVTSNNAVAVEVSGVRDSLRVLMVSGLPHSGQRTLRNIFKSDGSVELIHFAYLRSVQNLNPAPSDEMALIPFPAQELFVRKLDSFDLVVFDRFDLTGSLPRSYVELVRNYVERGGGLLVLAGPEIAGESSLTNSELGAILPARITGNVHEGGYLPRVTALGARHPVTSLLPGSGLHEGDDPSWGRWFRQVELADASGQTIMSGLDGHPLLVLDRAGNGRVALLASDHFWLWNRGVEGGGPQVELLRRLVHWLMKEPELEEEMLSASASNPGIEVTGRTLLEPPSALEVISPSGTEFELPTRAEGQGRYSAILSDPEPGLYRLKGGKLNAVAAIGTPHSRELSEAIATADKLLPMVDATGGGVFWLEDGVPDVRMAKGNRTLHGRDWLGLTPRSAYTTTGISVQPLLPAFLAMALAVMLLAIAWYREGT